MLQHDCGRQVSRVWHQDGCCCSDSLHLQIITVISIMIGPSWVLLCSDSAHCDRGKPEPAEPYQVEPTSLAVAGRRYVLLPPKIQHYYYYNTLLTSIRHVFLFWLLLHGAPSSSSQQQQQQCLFPFQSNVSPGRQWRCLQASQ